MFRIGSFKTGAQQFSGFAVQDGAAVAPLPRMDHDLPGGGWLPDMLADWAASFAVLERLAVKAEQVEAIPLRDLTVLPPVPRPGKILNAAANYKKHAQNMREKHSGGAIDWSKDYGFDKSKGKPYMFLRASSTISGGFDPIVLPQGMGKIDWEAELGVVIGTPAKHATRETAMRHVAGYVITNDVSSRDGTWREDRPALRSDWLSGKSYDTFAPTGPWFLPAAFVPEYRDLSIKLWLNGALMQDGLAGDMIFDVPDQIVYASSMMTLEPGDLIATGTPDGTGAERERFLTAGDVLEIEIDGLGRQRTPVVEDAKVELEASA